MKIAIFTPSYLPGTRGGGPERSTHGLAHGLNGIGHEIDIGTTDIYGQNRLKVPLDLPVEIDGVRVHCQPIAGARRARYNPALARLADNLNAGVEAACDNGGFPWRGSFIARAAPRTKKALAASPRGMQMPALVAGGSHFAKRAWIALQARCPWLLIEPLTAYRACYGYHLQRQTDLEALLPCENYILLLLKTDGNQALTHLGKNRHYWHSLQSRRLSRSAGAWWYNRQAGSL